VRMRTETVKDRDVDIGTPCFVGLTVGNNLPTEGTDILIAVDVGFVSALYPLTSTAARSAV
jgi:hypothetical protein